MKRIHVILEDNEHVSCLVFKLIKTSWEDGKIKCPLCKKHHRPIPKMDIIQHSFISESSITIMSCSECNQYFGMKYSMFIED